MTFDLNASYFVVFEGTTYAIVSGVTALGMSKAGSGATFVKVR